MPQKIRMWEITPQNTLSEISSSEINLEERLEDWLEADISVLDPNLLVIGRQVPTVFGGTIDLLCLDSWGGCVVVELKKGKTPREVTAQALDYASWVRDLSFDQIANIAERYSKVNGRTLGEIFESKFQEPLPDTINQSHRAVIVAESMDDSTERIVRYLSDFDVPINVATVQHFGSQDGLELLAQVFLIEPDVAADKAQSGSKSSRRVATTRELDALAEERGVGDLYQRLKEGVSGRLSTTPFTNTRLGIRARIEDRLPSVLIIELERSGRDPGLGIRLNGTRLMNSFGLEPAQMREYLPKGMEDMDTSEWRGVTEEESAHWHGFKGYFRTIDEIDKFLGLLKGQEPLT